MTKTYTTESNALRAAKSAGSTKEQVEILDADGAFYFEKIEAESFEQMVQEIHDAGTQVRQNLANTIEEDHVARHAETSVKATTPVAPIGAALEGDIQEYLCPHCGIHLSNGVGIHAEEVNGKWTVFTKKYENWCMACEGEFGPALQAPAEKKAKLEPKGDRVVTSESTAERPCKLTWVIADEMPGAKRKEVLEACVVRGIAYNTARTQYQQDRKSVV